VALALRAYRKPQTSEVSEMSLYDYKESQLISGKDYQFYALIMAAIRQADSNNLKKLSQAFPETYQEIKARYNAPDGVLPEDNAGLDKLVKYANEPQRDGREVVARAMLNKWRIQQNQVEELYPHDKEARMLAEASMLEILELMGVDIGPLELAPGQTNIVRELGEMDRFTP
jgi:hypothetical protein